MHTFEGSDGTRIHYNSDGSGEVRIVTRAIDVTTDPPSVNVSCTALVEFVQMLRETGAAGEVESSVVDAPAKDDKLARLLNATVNFSRGALMVALAETPRDALREVDGVLIDVVKRARTK